MSSYEAAAISNSSGRDHRSGPYGIDYGGEHDRERGCTEYMSAGLHALGDHGVRTALSRDNGLRD